MCSTARRCSAWWRRWRCSPRIAQWQPGRSAGARSARRRARDACPVRSPARAAPARVPTRARCRVPRRAAWARSRVSWPVGGCRARSLAWFGGGALFGATVALLWVGAALRRACAARSPSTVATAAGDGRRVGTRRLAGGRDRHRYPRSARCRRQPGAVGLAPAARRPDRHRRGTRRRGGGVSSSSAARRSKRWPGAAPGGSAAVRRHHARSAHGDPAAPAAQSASTPARRPWLALSRRPGRRRAPWSAVAAGTAS